MKKGLIIVESPAKIKTLRKFLGAGWQFASSVGHIRDLPEREFGIDLTNDFEPTYQTMPEKKEVIANIRAAAKDSDVVYLCPDPDREGEAIAWHIAHILPDATPYRRVTFNSITKDAVLRALEQPRDIDLAMVNAQQARRLLDRIVGYKISPILNRRIQRGREGYVSAGRVQSVALKLVVDREKEIEAFVPVEYWNIAALLQSAQAPDQPVRAALYSVDGRRVEKEDPDNKGYYLVGDGEAARAVVARMQSSPYTVLEVERREKRRNAVPPFITSTLQQEASRHHGFSATRTMNIAQSLYEGIDLGNEGTEGLITYMRTDSVRVAPEAVAEARRLIQSTYGSDYLPEQPKSYATKSGAQDAHEAIRPTNLSHPPEKVAPYLSGEQLKLYTLIWRRFLASQMTAAVYDTLSANIDAGGGVVVRATGSVLKFKGWLAAYEEKSDDDDKKDDEERLLPPLQEGQQLRLLDVTSEQAFTRPPPRYSEASLVKELEKSGIGRPSTYAAIMNKIQGREYTVKEGGRLKPTELGRVICQLLEDNFQQIMNVGFTAHMEDDLELIADQKREWKEVIRAFWEQFAPTLESAEKEAFVPKVETDIDCPSCGAKLQKVWFKSKYFLGCSRYPDCNFTAPLEQFTFRKEDYAADFNWEQPCPKCGSTMTVRHGRYGPFLGCSNYPTCRGIVNIPKKGEQAPPPAEDLPACPAIGCPGRLQGRRSRFGKIFYSCSTFPECDVIVNSLDQLATKYASHPRTPYVATKKGARAKGGAAAPKKGAKAPKAAKSAKAAKAPKEPKAPAKKRQQPLLTPSPALQKVVGTAPLSRGDAMKRLWDYIKERGLQDPDNKRLIRPDGALAALFGDTAPIDMFKMTALVSQHLAK